VPRKKPPKKKKKLKGHYIAVPKKCPEYCPEILEVYIQ
jgi:hypothetical protein